MISAPYTFKRIKPSFDSLKEYEPEFHLNSCQEVKKAEEEGKLVTDLYISSMADVTTLADSIDCKDCRRELEK
ncbi:MAG: hypothetical protein WC435_01085 [Candidatus Paceibacterota bacterium]